MVNLIVHDLKAPLSSVFLDLYMLEKKLDGLLTEDTRPHLGNVQNHAKTLVELIDTLLDVERLEVGVLLLEKEVIDPRAMLERLVQSSRSAAELKQIALTAELPPQLPALRVDEQLIQRVLQNLLSNALKFTPVGGKIHIDAAAENGQVRISVSDSGPGVPESQRPQIFQKFGQLDRNDQRRGYGLGLVFCKLAVEQHGGRISVEDAPAGGSRFVFMLPVEPVLN